MGDRPRQLKANASSRNAMGTALLRAALGWSLPWRGLPRVGEQIGSGGVESWQRFTNQTK